jgi:hypothetical protein
MSKQDKPIAKPVLPSPVPPILKASLLLDEDADFSTAMCAVNVLNDGTGEVTIKVDVDIMKRVRTRAGSVNLAEYFWQQMLWRALTDHVY